MKRPISPAIGLGLVPGATTTLFARQNSGFPDRSTRIYLIYSRRRRAASDVARSRSSSSLITLTTSNHSLLTVSG